MATYVQLAAEAVWRAQFVPDALEKHLNIPLRAFYGLGPALIGSPGDNNHLNGRHRSANWDRQSRYCTDRSYATTSTRDRRGNQDWYRATDVGITGQTLYDACRRLDTAVRAGQLPGLAEWFGTFDGQEVVGWFEGHPSTSDDSHLTHMHVGVWTDSANDAELMKKLYGIITGDDMDQQQINWLYNMGGITYAMSQGLDEVDQVDPDSGDPNLPGVDGKHHMLSLAPYWERVAKPGPQGDPGPPGPATLVPHTHDVAGTTGPAEA